jgi:hypothetical protein
MFILDFIKTMDTIDIILLFIVIVVVFLIVSNSLKVGQLEKLESVGGCVCLIPSQNSQESAQLQPISEEQNKKQDTSKPTLKLFYTDWCGFSQRFFPEWEKIKNGDLKNLVNFEQVDCVKSQNICNENNIGGYPSLIFEKQDKTKVNFPNSIERTESTVVNFVKENMN